MEIAVPPAFARLAQKMGAAGPASEEVGMQDFVQALQALAACPVDRLPYHDVVDLGLLLASVKSRALSAGAGMEHVALQAAEALDRCVGLVLRQSREIPVSDNECRWQIDDAASRRGKVRNNFLRHIRIFRSSADLDAGAGVEDATSFLDTPAHIRFFADNYLGYLRADNVDPDPSNALEEVHRSTLFDGVYRYFYAPRNAGRIADQIEVALFAAADHNERTQRYIDGYMLFHSALKHPQKAALRCAIFFGVTRPHQVPALTASDIETDEMCALRNDAMEIILSSIDLKRFVQHTGILCRKCKQDTVTRMEKQMRSADEATSIEYTCTSCGHKWRVN